MAKHHPQPDLLFEYATGSLSEPYSILVATHLALCPECRDESMQYEVVGGALLENIESTKLDQSVRDSTFAQLDKSTTSNTDVAKNRATDKVDLRVPQPLRSYLNNTLDDLNWKARGPVDEFRFLSNNGGATSRLLKIKSGKAMPRHTHDGVELTLVLSGGFTDQGLHFSRGDVETTNATFDHAPIADDDEDCYCLTIHDKPLRLSGPFTRFLNPFIRL